MSPPSSNLKHLTAIPFSPCGVPPSFSQTTSSLCSVCYHLTAHFLPSLICFCLLLCCFQVIVTGSSQQPPALSSVFLHHPLSPMWPFNPPTFRCCSAAWSSLALPYPRPRTPITHRQTPPAEFCHGFAGSQGFGCHSIHKRTSVILHSRLGCIIKAQAQKQTLDGQIFSQDHLLLTQHPDYYTMSTSLCKLLLSGIRNSPVFNATFFQLSHLRGGDVLPSVSSCQVENSSCMRGCPGGSMGF